MNLVGSVLDQNYEICQEIGEGGTGKVYLAWHRRLKKKVVLKKIKDNFVGRVNARGEADLLKQLHHEYLPQVYDFIQVGSQVFTVIDYVEGYPLSYYIERGQRFSQRQILIWIRQLCQVLDYLHRQNPPVIHSDIKPSNIMVRPQGDICLIDFNISLDGGQTISGLSERYASPEQVFLMNLAAGRPMPDANLPGGADGIDVRSDIYSLGITIYQLATGVRPLPYQPGSPGLAPLDADSLPYSRDFLRIVGKACSPRRENRYQSAAEMEADILGMKRRDREYRRAAAGQKMMVLLGTLLLAAGVGASMWGFQVRMGELFTEEYEQVAEIAGKDDYDAVISQGIDLLNEDRYRSAMRREPKKKADLLYMVANSYFEQEDYPHAISFYQEAVAFNQENPEYFRDYAIALARQEKTEEAREVLDQAVPLGLEEDHIYLVQAEIAAGRRDYGTAVENFQEAIRISENDYLRTRASLLCARVYRSLGEGSEERAILEEARNYADPGQYKAVTRALGAACVRAYNQSTEEQEKEAAIAEALDCYLDLVNGDAPAFQDQMNLAVVYEIAGKYQEAEQQFLDMKEGYPDDYRIYMRLALLYCSMEAEKAEEERDYSLVKENYDLAAQYYEKTAQSGVSDENMQDLEEIINQLYEKGWLSGE